MPSPTMCLVFCFSPFLLPFFLLFPSISIDDMGATSGVFSFGSFFFFACFQMGFYFVTTGWIFEIGLGVNSINQSIKPVCVFNLSVFFVVVCTIFNCAVFPWAPEHLCDHGLDI